MLKKVLKYLWPYRLPFLLALTEVFIMSGCELLKPWPLKIIIDNVLSGKAAPWNFAKGYSPGFLLLLATGGLVIIYIVLGGITVLNNYTTIKIGQQMVNDMRRDLYAHLQRLSLAFHNRRQVGDLLYRVTADTYAIQSLTMNGVFPDINRGDSSVRHVCGNDKDRLGTHHSFPDCLPRAICIHCGDEPQDRVGFNPCSPA